MKLDKNSTFIKVFTQSLIMLWMFPALLFAQIIPKAGFEQPSSYPLSSLNPEKVFVHTDKPYYLTGETLWFKAYCADQTTGRLSHLSAVLYVELYNQLNQPVAQLKTSLKNGTSKGQIKIHSSWFTGYYFLRAYTAWMRNGNENYFFHQPVSVINPLSPLAPGMFKPDSSSNSQTADAAITPSSPIEISTDHEIYGTRQTVTMDLSPSNNQELYHLDLSVSVYPYHPSLETGLSIIDTFHKGTQLFEKPPDSIQTIRYFPETVGPILYGQLSATGSAEQHLMASIGGEAARMYSPVEVDSTGFAVQLTKEVEYDHLYFWFANQRRAQITLDSVFDHRPIGKSSQPISFDSSTIKFIESQSVNMQVSNLYLEHTNIHGKQSPENKQMLPFYGHAEFQYNLDDYTRFPGLEEVFREYVKYVWLRKQDGGLGLFVWDHNSNHQSIANNVFFDQPALVLLDGIPVGSLDLLMEIDPLKIQSIEIVTKKYNVGKEVFHGIVSLKSYGGEFSGDEPLFGTIKISYSSLNKPLDFFHPNYQITANQRIPDRRNTLYWNPDLSITPGEAKQLQFYTGDTPGNYRVVVNGVTATGQPIQLSKTITILGGSTP